MAVEVPAVDRDRAGLSLGTAARNSSKASRRVGMARALARSAAGSWPAATRPSISCAMRLAWSGVMIPQRPRTMRRLGALRPPGPGR